MVGSSGVNEPYEHMPADRPLCDRKAYSDAWQPPDRRTGAKSAAPDPALGDTVLSRPVKPL